MGYYMAKNLNRVQYKYNKIDIRKMLKWAFIMSIILVIEVHSQCTKYCLNCPNEITCSRCQEGYFLFRNSSCPACPQWCKNCQMENNNRVICSRCSQLAQLNPITGSCFLCNPLCLNCSMNANNCTVCQNDRVLQIINNTGNCLEIPSCPFQNCEECSLDENNTVYCSKCVDGYFAFNFGCLLCRYPCLNCMYNFQILWQANIRPFWQVFLLHLYENNTNTNRQIPYFVNDFNFTNMTKSMMRGWTVGYFTLKTFQNMVSSNGLQDVILKIIDHIVAISNQSYEQIQNRLILELISMMKKNWTKNQINERILQMVNSYTSCIQCHHGFYFNTSIQNCMFCSQHCISCNNVQCLACTHGFFLMNSSCLPCRYPCSQCDGYQTNCTTCYAPTSLSELGTCHLCFLPCTSCLVSNFSFCLTCSRPFSHSASKLGTCYRCRQDLCLSCSSLYPWICFQCKNGYSLINGICQRCPSNCTICSTGYEKICFSCMQGFVLIDNRCVGCPSGCLFCLQSNPNFCLQCQNNTYLNSLSGKCEQCNSDCFSCMNPRSNHIPRSGLVIFGSQVIKCRPGCSICNPLKPQLCIQCMQRYFLVVTVNLAFCKFCSEGCRKCINHYQCINCLPNYLLTSGICYRCSENCQTCSLSQCITCKRGFALLGNGSCIENCGKHCIQCHSESNQCIACQQGYTLEQNRKQCIKCLSSCSGTCDPRNITICIDCVEGFQLLENSCVRCPKGCLQCLSGSCSVCKQGYSLVKQNSTESPFICEETCIFPCRNGTLSMCFSCFSGFILLNNSCLPDIDCNPNCEYCPSGTFINITDGTCQLCALNCASCQNESTCLLCFDGFALTMMNNVFISCVVCPFQCRTCYDNLTCKICIEGYTKQILYMIGGVDDAVFSDQCVICQVNCKTCLVEPDRCESCHDDSYLLNHHCINFYTVKYMFQLDRIYTDFLTNSESHEFSEAVSNLVQVSIDDHYLDAINQGSTIINGTIAALNEEHARNIQNNINGGILAGYKVLSFSSMIYYGSEPHEIDIPLIIPQLGVDGSIGFFVGVLVGGIVALLILIIVIIRLRNRAQINVKIMNDTNQTNVQKSENLSNISEQKKKNRYNESQLQIEVVFERNSNANNVQGSSDKFSES